MPNKMQTTSERAATWSDKKKKLTDGAKSDICKAMTASFQGREFGNHDIKQVQESLKAEGKDANDHETVMRDMENYANKTGWAEWGKVDMAMAA